MIEIDYSFYSTQTLPLQFTFKFILPLPKVTISFHVNEKSWDPVGT